MPKRIAKVDIKPFLAGNPGVRVYDVIVYDATGDAQSDAGKRPEGYWSERITFPSKETLRAFLEGLRICQVAIGSNAEAEIKIPSSIPR